MKRLPHALDLVLVEDSVIGDDRQVFRKRLDDEQPVEWIAVNQRQVGDKSKVRLFLSLAF